MHSPTILLLLSGLTFARAVTNPFRTKVYYDYTSFIDNYLQGNGTDRLQIIQADITRRFAYYSTDSPISKLAELHPVTDLVTKFFPSDSTRTSTSTSIPSPILNFRLVSNGSSTLKDGIFEDLLYDPSDIRLAEASSLRQVDRIILDLTHNGKLPCLEGPTVTYLQQRNFSLPLFAKRLAGRILGRNFTSKAKGIKVGLQFNQGDAHCKFIRLQASKADFLVVRAKLQAVTRTPMSFGAFRDFVEMGLYRSLEFFNFTAPATFHLTMETNDSFGGVSKDLELQRLLRESQDVFFPMLEKFTYDWLWGGRRHLVKQIILTSPDGAYHEGYNIWGRFLRNNQFHDWMYLFVRETEVTPCALQTMLSYLDPTDVIVNEYTWNALVHHQSEMDIYPSQESSRQCPNATSIYGQLQRIHMIISKGTGRVWGPFRRSLDSLLQSHSSVAEYSLSTVLFHASDIDESEMRQNGEFRLPQDGIRNFIKNVSKTQNISFGCVADLGPLRKADDSTHLVSKSKKDCEAVMEWSSIVVWKFEINFDLIDNFPATLSFVYSRASLKYNLFQIIAARNKFMAEFEGKQVIIQLEPDNSFFHRYGPNSNNSTCFEPGHAPYDSYFESLESFGRIYGVKMVIQPAYDVKHPWFGRWGIPTSEGKVTSNRQSCYHIMGKK